jgi:serine protease DegS
MIKLINFLRWPALFGLLLAVMALQLFPELNPRAPKIQTNNPSFVLSDNRAPDTAAPRSYAAAVSRAMPAVVNIYTRTKIAPRAQRLFNHPLYRSFYNSANIPQQERMQSALGSGVIISEQGYLLTSNHVTDGADEIVVQLQDGREGKAQLIGVDMENDLAVLKVDLDKLTAISIGSPQSAQVGDIVLAIGNPFGVGQTVTQGIISATGRHGLGISTYENFIQTDAAINPGNSGGALIDVHGNLLGINTAILDRVGNSNLDGVGLAIPADTAVRTLKDIVEFGRVVRGWLGIEAKNLTPQLANSLKLDSTNGVLVTRIYNNGPAHLAGLKPGDVIVKINGEFVGNGNSGQQQIAESRPGDKVDIEFYRAGKKNTAQAVLEKNPTSD